MNTPSNIELRQSFIPSKGKYLSWPTKFILSPRSILCFVVLAATYLAIHAPWLRPPLSADLRGCEIPLSCADVDDDTSVLSNAGSNHWDSPGLLIVVAIWPVAFLAVVAPRYSGLLGGTLLVATCATHTMVAANHPRLFELLEQQQTQRRDMTTVFEQATWGEAVASLANGRVSGNIVPVDRRGQMFSATRFALYGTWLAPMGVAVILFGSGGNLARRVLKLGVWTFIAIVLSLGLCSSRLKAEWHWHQARQLTLEADYAAARKQLSQALLVCPELRHLQRTWFLAGKLDYHSDLETHQRVFFQASQLAQQDRLAKAGDLLVPLLAQPDLPIAVRTLAADIRTRLGIIRFLDETKQQDRGASTRIAAHAASAAWRSALEMDPHRIDCLVYLTLYHTQTPEAVELIDRQLDQLIDCIADRTLRADLIAAVGDAFFEAGDFGAARRCYRKSREQYELPKSMNFRARRGLVGT